MHRYRSHSCGALAESDVGSMVRLSGWVHRVRDHGGLLFIDLRDHYGVTQLVVVPGSPVFEAIGSVRAEYCIRVDGDVKARTPDTVNSGLSTGKIEVFIRDFEILGASADLPLPVFGEPDYPEEVRLRHRFLDLRRETLHAHIMTRLAIVADFRERMTAAGFGEFTTPILTASSPEGARDFLVPSRVHRGQFYALPQAPQQFKQMIMMAGFERYFQIAPCFRDEDPRSDRLPGEFYQFDVEMSFVTQDDVLELMESVIRGLFERFSDGKSVTRTFPRISYERAMRDYGSDKPDLRNPIVMRDVTEYFRGSGFKIFAAMIEKDANVEIWAIPARRGGSRAFCDRMNSWAQSEGQPGLGYIFWRREDEGTIGAGPVARNIGADRTEALRVFLELDDGDACFFVAGRPSEFVHFASAARTRIGTELGLIDENAFELCWIVDFPMFEWNEDERKVDFCHNPFSMPQGGLDALDGQDPLTINAYQYDMVCNGYEIASGAIRNHDPEIMRRVFAIAGHDEAVLKERFGGIYRALHYGAPPHGGMAAGLDRIVMLICGVNNLREITLFPMNQQACDPLMGAPGEVDERQLKDLGIRLLPRVSE